MESVQEVLSVMELLVKKGKFVEAAEIGNAHAVPLGISSAQLGLKGKVYQGQQGSVFRCSWNGQEVAVKRARIGTSSDLDRFRSEVRLLALLGDHSNIVPLLAARVLPPDYLLVFPFQPSNLVEMMHSRGWKKPNAQEILNVALQLARGLCHVHGAGILHRDIKPANILSGQDGAIRIADFGIAEMEATLAAEHADRQSLVGQNQPSGGFHKKHLVGTLEYLAPEVLLKQPYSYPADIYSWAVTVNEFVTGVTPFSDCTKDNPAAHTVLNFGYGRQELAAAVVSEGLRPIMSPDTPQPLVQILEDCWQLDPSKRPSAAALVAQLEKVAVMLGLSNADKAALDQSTSSHVISEKEAKQASSQPNGEAAGKSLQEPGAPEGYTADLQLPRWALCLPVSNCFTERVVTGHFETAGLRGADRMEDRSVLASPMGPGSSCTHLLAVFDGHRGAEAADFAAMCLQDRLRQNWGCDSAQDAFKACFMDIDTSFREKQEQQRPGQSSTIGRSADQHRWPGCTAIAALIAQGHLWVANAGDCRAVLCRAGKALQVSKEHTADSPQERARIEQAGGKLRQFMGSWRVGDAGIQVTRSIGDSDLKSSGLTSEPEVTTTQLTAEDEFLVLASDGLWDKLSSQDTVDLVHDTVKEASLCAKRLATEALTRGSGDNITVIVAFLQPVDTIEEIYSKGRQKYRPAATHHGGRHIAMPSNDSGV